MPLYPRPLRVLSRIGALSVAVLMMALVAAPAHADVIFGQSEGYGIDLSIDFGGPTVDINEAGYSAGAGMSPYNNSNFVANAGVSGVFLELVAEAITSDVSSDVDGLPGNRTVTGASTVTAISFGAFFGYANGSAELITSDASVTGDYGSLTAVGDVTLVDATITINGVTLIVPVNPTPNFVLFNSGGITIVLNEQITSGDGISSAGIEVNAVHITLNNVGGVVNGDVIVGHSTAVASAVVPEPASMSLMLLGTGVMLFRRRRNAQAA